MDGIGPDVLKFFEDRIVRPLDEMHDQITSIDSKLTGHIAEHDQTKRDREVRKQQMVSAVKWIGGALLGLMTAVIGARGL